jgi:DNA-binding NtrC family response regulator
VSEHCILVIEDQEDLVELYEATLRHAGYRVRTALTGEEGLAEFCNDGADIVLLDMTLPEMQGTEVLREIRAIDANVPVIVITGEAGQPYRDQCEQLGVCEYLSKPPDYTEILAAIERALETKSEEAQLVTLRLPKRVIEQLNELDSNLERAITQLVDSQRRKATKKRGAST